MQRNRPRTNTNISRQTNQVQNDAQDQFQPQENHEQYQADDTPYYTHSQEPRATMIPESHTDHQFDVWEVCSVSNLQTAKDSVKISLEGHQLLVLPDSGAQINTIPQSLVPDDLFHLLKPTQVIIKPFHSPAITPTAEMTVNVTFENQTTSSIRHHRQF